MSGNEWREAASDAGTPPVKIDTSVAHIARVQDYWLAAGTISPPTATRGDEVAAFPGLVASVRSTRAFLARTVRSMWGGVGQK